MSPIAVTIAFLHAALGWLMMLTKTLTMCFVVAYVLVVTA